MTIKRFRKKPVVIEAIQWTGDNEGELITFTDDQFQEFTPEYPHLDMVSRVECGVTDLECTAAVHDHLHSTWVGVKTGQWVIKGVKGEYYPCDAEVLAETYDEVGEDTGSCPDSSLTAWGAHLSEEASQ